MIMKIRRGRIDKTSLLLFALLTTSISYIGYWFTAIQDGGHIYFSYDISTKGILSYIRYVDDAMFIILPLMWWRKQIHKSSLYYIFAGIVWGICSLWINTRFSWILVLSGIRCFLPFLVLLEWYMTYEHQILDYNVIKKCVNLIVIVQTLACILLSIICNVYRSPGLFGNAGALGIFCSGAVTFYFVYFALEFDMKWREYIFYQLMLLAIIVLTDSRSAMVIFFITVLFGFLIRIKVSKKPMLNFVLIIPALPVAVEIANNISARGNIIVQNIEGGRLQILIRFFQQNLLSILFGGGLGYGTNTAVTIGSTDLIVDGTVNTLLYQFGIVGGGILIYILVRLVLKITYGTPMMFRLGFAIDVFLISFNANIFEAGGYLIFITLCFHMIISRNRFS